MCWYISTSPPPAGSKKLKPSERSKKTMNCETAMNGVAMTTSSDVEKFAQTSSGIRKKLIPGARIVMIVTRKFSAVAIDDAPANCTPIVKNTCPSGAVTDSGAYAVQPLANEPPGARNDSSIMIPASGSIQNDSAFRRGNAMSGAPIMSGRTKFARPAKTGMMKRKISSDAWTLKRPLNVFGSTNWRPGCASSARISIANRPPTKKKKNEVTTYWMPMTLWSVLTLK